MIDGGKSMKRGVASLLFILQLYISYLNWIERGNFMGSLEVDLATIFSILLMLALALFIIKPDLFLRVFENELVEKTWRRFKKNTGGKFGGIIIIILFYLAFMAPFVAPYSPTAIDYTTMTYSPPSTSHWLGTDDFGRDLLSRIIYGSRIALGVAFASVFVNAILGVSLGLIAAYYGGRVDTIIMRLVEIWNSIPFILLALAIISALGTGIFNVIIAVGLTGLINFARITRSAVLPVKEKSYITAVKALGGTDTRILFRHIIPNILSPLIVMATLRIGLAILMVTSLSFLGLGVQPPLASWGTMLKRGQEYLTQAPWISIFPGLAIIITVLSFNLLGDALRDALDPKDVE